MEAALRARLGRAVGGAGSLRRRAIGAGLWRLGGHGSQQVIRLGSNLIMTRLLVPEDFGLMAIVFAIHTGLVMISDVGLRQSVIRADEGETTVFLRTAWTLQVIQYALLGMVLALVALALSSAGSRAALGLGVFGDPRLPDLLVASIAILMLQGLQSMKLALANRRLALGRVVAMEVASQVIGVVVMIGCALHDPSVWALVIGATAGAATKCLLSHALLPGPSMRLNWHSAHSREIWHFGKWLIGSSLTGFVVNQGDRFILGALLDVETFGLYAIAMMWVDGLAKLLTMLSGQIGQPALNEVRRRGRDHLAKAFAIFRRSADAVAAMTFLGAVFIAFIAFDFLYPERYAGTGGFIAILALQLLTLRYAPLVPFALSQGESRAIFTSTLTAMTALLVTVPLAHHALGLQGALFAVAMVRLWFVPQLLAIASRHLHINRLREVLELTLLVMFGIAWASMI